MALSSDTLRELLVGAVGREGWAAVSIGMGPEEHDVWTTGSGATDVEPAFLIYSVTKIFTAVALLRLQESGRVDLDDHLERWFPEVPGASRISLRRMLNHSSGLPDYGGLLSYHESVRADPGSPWSFERFAAETYEKGLAYEPGEGWAYSNPGYMLLRRVIEAVAGDAYDAVLRREIAAPVGLERTSLAESSGDLGELAPGPSALLRRDGTAVDARTAYHPGWVSHGVLASTASETRRFLEAVFDGTLLGAHSLREMITTVAVPGAPAPWVEPRYGLGLMVDPAAAGGPIYGHNGEGPGYNASAFRIETRAGALTICVLCGAESPGIAERTLREVASASEAQK